VATVVIALGSNLGDRLAALQGALDALDRGVRWERVSQVYETAPMYVADQPAYLNAAAQGKTELGPLALLDLLKQTERAIGRASRERFGPRELDLDLIVYGRLWLASTRGDRELLVPHPRMPERRFVLAPLADLDPSRYLPGMGTVELLLQATNDQAGDVLKLEDALLSLRRD
jgi:2-amino-4-hydroxy-6-hydroxymethyldihydropteridine diphosphokinase